MALSQVALLVAGKQSSYIFNYQQQESLVVILAVMCTAGTARITVGTVVTARITFLHVFIRSSNIRLSYILSRLFIISRVYLEPT